MTTREEALEKALTMIRDKWVPALLRDCREADKTDCNAHSVYSVCVRALATPPSPVEREKTIKVTWVLEPEFGYGKAMRVVASDHPRFVERSRFDWGFAHIATEEGYTLEIGPVPKNVIATLSRAQEKPNGK